jgi:hypothetical protein
LPLERHSRQGAPVKILLWISLIDLLVVIGAGKLIF